MGLRSASSYGCSSVSLPLGGVKCHHPHRLFTRVITRGVADTARWFVIGKQSTVGLLQRLARVEGAVDDCTQDRGGDGVERRITARRRDGGYWNRRRAPALETVS